MNTFKRKSLYAALAGVSVLGATTAVQAVNVNPDGLGQFLMYPYYTVRVNAAGNAFNTLLSVVNTTRSVKVVKVRFLEGKRSKEVLDFNLYLSPNDVWTGAISPNGSGAQINTTDKSCTNPGINSGPGAPQGPIPFKNGAYTTPPDPTTGSLDRTREGYFEIIEMGIIANTTLAIAATHTATGTPSNCALVQALDTGGLVNGLDVVTPNGGLFGSESLVNVNSGTDYTADPVVLDNWRDAPLWTDPTSVFPNLQNASPQTSLVFLTGIPFTNAQTWGGVPTNAADPVSAVLMHDNVYNEFTVETAAGPAATDWVVTFPTKTFYVNGAVNTKEINVSKLFQRNYISLGSCDDIGLTVFDREEQSVVSTGFSPVTTPTFSICWEANVIAFQNTSNLNPSVLGSINVSVQPTTFQNGWARLSFPVGAGNSTVVTANHQLRNSNSSQTYFGLPAIGFAVTSYTFGQLTPGVLSNYGGNWIHKASRLIQ